MSGSIFVLFILPLAIITLSIAVFIFSKDKRDKD